MSRFSVAMTIRRKRGSKDAQTNGNDLRTVVFGEIDVGWRINVEHLHLWHDLSVNELDSKTGVPWGLPCAMCTLPNSFHFVPMFQSPLRTCGPVNGFQAAGAVNDSFQMLDCLNGMFCSLPCHLEPHLELSLGFDCVAPSLLAGRLQNIMYLQSLTWVKCYSNLYIIYICVVLPLSLHWNIMTSLKFMGSDDVPPRFLQIHLAVSVTQNHIHLAPPKKCGLRKNGAQFFCCCCCCCCSKETTFVVGWVIYIPPTKITPSTLCDCVLLGFSAAGQMIWQLEIPRLGSMKSWWAFCLLQAGVSMRTGIFIVICKVGITPC